MSISTRGSISPTHIKGREHTTSDQDDFARKIWDVRVWVERLCIEHLEEEWLAKRAGHTKREKKKALEC
jgi:hypothetical protein